MKMMQVKIRCKKTKTKRVQLNFLPMPPATRLLQMTE